MNVSRFARSVAIAGGLIGSCFAVPALAQVGIDGVIGAEWSGPGVTARTVTYDPGAPLGNFGTPGTTNHAVAYTTYFRADSTYVYAAVAANPGGGGSAAGVQFANLYFSSTTPSNGSIAIEVLNNKFFRGGVNTGGPNNDGYYPAAGYATSASSVPNGVIEVAIPISFFQTDPLGMGFNPSTDHLRFNLSQSLGYSVVGGTAYNAPMGPDERLGVVTFAPPAYAVQLQSSNDCLSSGMLTANIVLTSAPAMSAASGGQFFLSYDPGLSISAITSITPGPGLLLINRSRDNTTHTAYVAIAVDYLTDPLAKLNAGQTLATITFAAPGTYCSAADLVTFRGNDPPTRLTDNGGNAIGVGTSTLGAITLNDTTGPTITCPAPANVAWSDGKDPWATGYATATDNCDPSPVITYVDDRSGLVACGGIGGRGTISRVWTAVDHCGNSSTCTQTITVTDNTPPSVTVPANIATNADAGSCSAVVNFLAGTAYDQQHFQGFEDAGYLAGGPSVGLATDSPSTDWNSYNSAFARVPSGTDGIPSRTGAADGRIDPANVPAPPNDSTGIFSRLGGYSNVFGNGFVASQDIYINLADTTVGASTYGFDVSVAASNQSGSGLRDFIFHAAGSPGHVYIAADNNSNFARRNDLNTLANYADLTSSGWYHFEWNFRNAAGVLAVDMNLYDAAGNLLFTETRSTPSDLIATVVGGNRYMWFTFVVADNLHIDNTSLIRPLPTMSSPASGSSFASGTNMVTVSATDACGNPGSNSFTVTVNPFNTLDARVQEAGLNLPSMRCVSFDMWQGCASAASVSGNFAFNSTNAIDFESYANGDLPGATTPTDTRTSGDLGTWWLPGNAATSGQVSPIAAHSGTKGLIVGNRGNGGDGVIDNLKTPRLNYASGETVMPVNAASSKFVSSYWFRTASMASVNGFSFKSESYGPDRTTYFGAFSDTGDLYCGAYAIEQVSPGQYDFVFHPIASGMAWGTWYRVEVSITFVNGSDNDVVSYSLFNSANVPVGPTLSLHDWEQGARLFGYNGGAIFGVDAIQFQARGDTSGGGAHDVAYVDDITYTALPAVLLDVPCSSPAYTAVTARDVKHSLRRTGTASPFFGVAANNYFARFDNNDMRPLEQGNLNDDQYVDILDAGIFLGQFNNTPGGSTPCGYMGNHADFDGDGIVFTGDFTFIQAAFLHFRDLDPCGAALTGEGPVTDISVDDAMSRGLRDVAMMDYTLDGRVNSADIAWVAANGLPRCIADFNDDQTTSVQDIFSYLNAWFMGHPRADFHNRGHVDVQDIFDFINTWFQGC